MARVAKSGREPSLINDEGGTMNDEGKHSTD
jgi:hypothetical protein